MFPIIVRFHQFPALSRIQSMSTSFTLYHIFMPSILSPPIIQPNLYHVADSRSHLIDDAKVCQYSLFVKYAQICKIVVF